MRCKTWAKGLVAPVLVAAALVVGALPAPAAAAPFTPAPMAASHGAGAQHGAAPWFSHPPSLPGWLAGDAGPGRAGPPSYTAVIANNCDDLSFPVCAEYGGESEYALFHFNGDGTGSGVGRISLTLPGVGKVTYYGVIHITHWQLAAGNPWADFFPGTQDFYATSGTMDLTTVTAAGTTHQHGLPLGLPFIETGPGAHLSWNHQTYPAGDTGVTLKLGLTRITTLYPPLSASAGPVQVPADVPLYLFVTEHP